MKFRAGLLAATIVALPLAVHAQPISGVYVGAGFGVNFLQDKDISVSNGASGQLRSKDVSQVFVGSMGWGFGNGYRAEIEGNYRVNNFNGSGSVGREQKYGAMLNGFYDFDVAPWVTPYIGAGIGYQRVGQHNTGIFSGGNSVQIANANRNAFAYQAIGGVAFPVYSLPGLAITAEYRFLGLAGDRTYSGTATNAVGVRTPVNVKSGEDYNHNFLIGLRYAFGGMAVASATTVSAATPAQPAATARNYLVFFDWDRSDLSDRARGVIRDAAANSAKVAYTKIDVNGNADTSGTPAYNQALSMRRAQTVAAELTKDGVPRAAISITASGDTHLLVATGPGVREPQNRRVEIVIR
jgi:OOP family OmpA-OmpF porin